MRVPADWLREYVEFDEPPAEIAERLTKAGLEVGEIVKERFGYEKSFVGRVAKCEKHPKRPDFYVLTIAGAGADKTVLTNLRPFEVGEIIPVAYEGFIFPDGTKLEPMKFSGVESDAKIMAEWDVDYSDDKGVILPLPAGAEVGACITDVMGITTDVFVFDLTANRGDCLCVFGIARELAAILGRPLKKNVFDVSFPEEPRDVQFSVEIKDTDLCPRYSGRVIQEIVIGQSPLAMRRRLTACGMRPINGIVDVTNYVMLEAGQPLHAFDLDTLEERAIIVRRAAEGETIVTIDAGERQLTTDMLVIADKSRPVALAGVMGGMQTEITDKTKNMLLESAHFEPRCIRRTATRLDMKSEASLRFEKGVAVTTVADSSNYASYLIWKNGWGKPLSGLIDACPVPHKPVKITVAADKIRGFISPEISDEIIEDTLTRLDFKVENKKGEITATAPGHRMDISIWQDLAEEVARIYGYERITSELPMVKTHRAMMMPNLAANRSLRGLLVRAGLSEAITFSFTRQEDLRRIMPDNPPAAVPIRNPLTEDQTHLRPTIAPNMLKVIAHNRNNVGDAPLQLFELGRVFRNPENPTETDALVIAVSGRTLLTPTKSDYRFDQPCFYALKGAVERFLAGATTLPVTYETAQHPMYHPYRCAEVFVDGNKIGVMGEVHPEVCARFDIKDTVAMAEIELEYIKSLLGAVTEYKKISRQPALHRDLSIIVDYDVPAQKIADVIRDRGTELLESVSVFDVFTGDIIGDNRKSVSFSLEFRHPARTLNDEQVAPIMENIISAIAEKTGGSLREM